MSDQMSALLPLRDIVALSADPGDNRILCLHFKREVSGSDREAILAAVNLAPRSAPPPTTGDNPVPISNIKDKTDGN